VQTSALQADIKFDRRIERRQLDQIGRTELAGSTGGEAASARGSNSATGRTGLMWKTCGASATYSRCGPLQINREFASHFLRKPGLRQMMIALTGRLHGWLLRPVIPVRVRVR
jgi:hypothetical protein